MTVSHRHVDGIYAVYPHRRFAPSQVHVFVEALRTALGPADRDPWWPADTRAPGAVLN
jgi:hypothetical protein